MVHLICRKHYKINKKENLKMKKTRSIFMLIVCCIMTAAAFTSCLSEGEDTSLDVTTQKQYQQQMAGQYSGMLRMYYAKTTATGVKAEKYDSVRTYWTVNSDSTLTLRNFPVSKLDSAISVPANDLSEKANMLRELKSQLKSAPSTNLKAYYFIPNKNAVTSSSLYFYVNPVTVETTFNYNNAEKKVYFVFYMNTYTGSWTSSDRLFQFQLGTYAICFDTLDLNNTTAITSYYLRDLYMTCTAK